MPKRLLFLCSHVLINSCQEVAKGLKFQNNIKLRRDLWITFIPLEYKKTERVVKRTCLTFNENSLRFSEYCITGFFSVVLYELHIAPLRDTPAAQNFSNTRRFARPAPSINPLDPKGPNPAHKETVAREAVHPISVEIKQSSAATATNLALHSVPRHTSCAGASGCVNVRVGAPGGTNIPGLLHRGCTYPLGGWKILEVTCARYV